MTDGVCACLSVALYLLFETSTIDAVSQTDWRWIVPQPKLGGKLKFFYFVFTLSTTVELVVKIIMFCGSDGGRLRC